VRTYLDLRRALPGGRTTGSNNQNDGDQTADGEDTVLHKIVSPSSVQRPDDPSVSCREDYPVLWILSLLLILNALTGNRALAIRKHHKTEARKSIGL
jgi:hypothetical protein